MLLSRLTWQILTRLLCNKMASKGLHNEDNKLDTFRRICDEIAGESSYLKKAERLQRFFEKGSSGKGFKGDTVLWVQFLIPAANQRVYNLQNKALIKLFSRIFNADQQQMHLDLEQGKLSFFKKLPTQTLVESGLTSRFP